MGSLRSNNKTKTKVKTIETCVGGFTITEYAREGVFRVDAPAGQVGYMSRTLERF
jgi:hypothetical protein